MHRLVRVQLYDRVGLDGVGTCSIPWKHSTYRLGINCTVAIAFLKRGTRHEYLFHTLFMQHTETVSSSHGRNSPRLPNSNGLLEDFHIFMATLAQEQFHAFQHLRLQIWPRYILAWEPSIRSREFDGLECFPYPVDLSWRQRNHVGISPHEGVCHCVWESIGVIEAGLAIY